MLPEDGGILNRLPQPLDVQTGCTVGQALNRLGYSPEDIQCLFDQRSVAVFGHTAAADTTLHPGDRIELLDALRFDPKESRRRRAAHKAGSQQGKTARRSGKARA